MKAAIYNPYLDTLGGGERYTITFAKALLDFGYKVDLQWPETSIKQKLEKRFGMELPDLNIVKDIKRGDGYDVCFWVSDGSIPTLKSRKNFLHFQVPFHHLGGNNLLNKMKLFRVDQIICNSHFTKRIIDKEYGVESIVIYPPVPTAQIKPKRKENIILYVGRFSELKQNKGQDILIKAFKKFTDGEGRDWKLILAGGVEIGVGGYIEKLKKMVDGYAIEIVTSPDFKTLTDLYGKAKFFWSASGYGEDEEKNPEKVEHFGITVIEAMAGGAVPVIFAAGGHKEIIKDGENGLLWAKEKDLLVDTTLLINNKQRWRNVSESARMGSKKYGYERFKSDIEKIL